MKRNGKSDMRGKKITVLSQEGRDNYDRIFRSKKLPKNQTREKKETNE